MQERLGLELTSLVEDPSGVTVQQLAAEACARLQAGQEHPAVQSREAEGSKWIVPCPVNVKLRLFCLPYAGGVSENVFGRCGLSGSLQPQNTLPCLLLLLRAPLSLPRVGHELLDVMHEEEHIWLFQMQSP